MDIGINYPWIDYGWDFGDPPAAWVSGSDVPSWRERKRARIEEDFGRFKTQGITAVRWFLLGDGLNYGMGPSAPQWDGSRWRFNPLPAGHPFYQSVCEDFEAVLRICGRTKMKLLPSLIDFHWCKQGIAMGGSSGIVKGGRYDVVRDGSKRMAFFDRVLDPLLECAMTHRDSIYAWEIINEPEWVVRRFSFWWNRDRDRTVTRREMQEFIAEGIRRINLMQRPGGGAAFASTVGFAHWETMDKWRAGQLGVTLGQYHYYAQNDRELPDCRRLSLPGCMVGEFATTGQKEWPDLKVSNREQTVSNKLRCLEQKGYPACFLWSARAQDHASSWNDPEHRELLSYMQNS